MIKNGKRHLTRGQEQGDVVEVLRDFLKGIADQKGDLPSSFDSKAYFNSLVKDLISANPEKFSTHILQDGKGNSNGVQYHQRPHSMANQNYVTPNLNPPSNAPIR